MAICQYCSGSGVQESAGRGQWYPCPDCNGSGYVPDCDLCGDPVYGGYCEHCCDKCERCGEIFRKDELQDGLCDECRAECYSANMK